MWRVELVVDGEFQGVVYEHKDWAIARRFCKRYVKDKPSSHQLTLVKVGGVPLQCCIDGTKAHYFGGLA